LPSILAARRAAFERWREEVKLNALSGRYFFERIPRVFEEHYRPQFEDWCRTHWIRGGICAVPFDVRPGGHRPVDGEGRGIWAGAYFEGTWDYACKADPVFVIRPASETDRELHACRARV
jgi:hypothetical protein